MLSVLVSSDRFEAGGKDDMQNTFVFDQRVVTVATISLPFSYLKGDV